MYGSLMVYKAGTVCTFAEKHLALIVFVSARRTYQSTTTTVEISAYTLGNVPAIFTAFSSSS